MKGACLQSWISTIALIRQVNRHQLFTNQCGAPNYFPGLVSCWLQIMPNFATNSNAHPLESHNPSLQQFGAHCLVLCYCFFTSIGVDEIRCKEWDGTLSFHLHSRNTTCFYTSHYMCIFICNGITTWSRQICEQIVFEVCIPPFLLRLTWCSHFFNEAARQLEWLVDLAREWRE